MSSTEDSDSINSVSVGPEARRRIDQSLNGRFTVPAPRQDFPGIYRHGRGVAVDPAQLPSPSLVAWVLGDVIGAPNLGRAEKVAWEYSLEFEGRAFTLALQKFGLRLYVDDDESADQFVLNVVQALSHVARVVEREVFADFADSQVRQGNVTVSNQYHRLRAMYEHFRRLAEQPAVPDDEDFGEGSIAPVFNKRAREEALRFFNGVAMVNAYFSLLEHALVLVWPFVSYEPGVDDLERFISKRWGEKFKTVFDVTKPGKAKELYDRLRLVAEEYRNTYAHGGFDKYRTAFLIHFPGGAVPANLSDVRDHPQFHFFPIPEPQLIEIAGLLDEVDAWLESGPASFGMHYVSSGLDAIYSADHLAEAHAAMDADEFEGFVERLGHEFDRMSNMDW